MTRTSPPIATNRSGHVAVVWEDDRDSTGPEDNAHCEIFLRLFRDGVAVYELKLSARRHRRRPAWRHLSPDVGLDDKGNAVVVWADDPDGNGFYNIPYRVVSPTGTVLGSGNANANAAGQQIQPDGRGRPRRHAEQPERGRVHRGLGGHPGHRARPRSRRPGSPTSPRRRTR